MRHGVRASLTSKSRAASLDLRPEGFDCSHMPRRMREAIPQDERLTVDRRTFTASLLGIMTLPAVPAMGGCSHTKGGEEEKLVVMPVLNSPSVFVVPPLRPHCFVHFLGLEGFGCRNWQVVPNAAKGVWSTSHNWDWKEDGTFGSAGRVAENIVYRFEMRPQTDMLEMRVTILNRGRETLEDLYCGMCVDIRRNGLMYDPALARSHVSVDGRPVPMNRTDVAGSHGGVMPVYFLRGTTAANRSLPEALTSYGWAVSPTEVDSPLTAVVSTDGTWTVGAWFWPCSNVTGNGKLPFYGCIHSNPTFGTVRPGTAATAVGRLYAARGGMQDVWTRMTTDWRRAQAAGASSTNPSAIVPPADSLSPPPPR